MAFDPYASQDMTNAFAVTPAQRLQSTLSGTKYGNTGAQQKFALGSFDTSKAYKKQRTMLVVVCRILVCGILRWRRPLRLM